MKAYVVDNDQPSGVRFTEVSDPRPAPNEAVIEVEAFSLNHGELPGSGVFPVGTVPGWDTAGRVITEAADGGGPGIGTSIRALDHRVVYRGVETEDGSSGAAEPGLAGALLEQESFAR